MNDPSLPQKSREDPDHRFAEGRSREADRERRPTRRVRRVANIQAKLGLAKFSPPAYSSTSTSTPELDRYTQRKRNRSLRHRRRRKGAEKPAPAPQKQAEDTPVDPLGAEGPERQRAAAVGALQGEGAQGSPT